MLYTYNGETSRDLEELLNKIDLSYEFELWIYETYDKQQLIDFLFEGWIIQDLEERFYDRVLENPEMVGIEIVNDEDEEEE